ncbi:MAG: aminotransferase class I/II-fold pyridoxal phosphate-dependent enzyme [Candidatus Eremiobacteraeota bacterium]|nr:aminotransferase class I/II-fold pyridoxal phosphate-dependent enzyme [Candidatus Eremiobacteraeota bacterium]MBV8356180.1 aminotransferase class I/II-fold pyridoxal phosphate-dependent enzyme [Candidatus Eremiobacteraeota bacterium]
MAGVPITTPFVAPEVLARTYGHAEMLRLGANESSFGPSPRAIEAMRAEAHRTSWYGDPESYDLRSALAERLGCSVENVVIGSGIDDLHSLIVRTFCAPNDVALETEGTYATFAYHVAAYGVRLRTVPYRSDGRVDVEALIRVARSERPKLIYLANPDNPSGTFLEPEAVTALRDGLLEDQVLALDEAYADFVPPAGLVAPLVDPQVIRMRTFSKAHGLAGARVGYAIADKAIIATFQNIRQHFGVNRLGQIAALASLADDGFARSVVAEIERGREDYYALAERHGLRAVRSWTNFVCIEIGTRAEAEEFLSELLRRGVFVRKPAAPPLDGYIRVTVGTPDERKRFAKIFGEILAAGASPRTPHESTL